MHKPGVLSSIPGDCQFIYFRLVTSNIFQCEARILSKNYGNHTPLSRTPKFATVEAPPTSFSIFAVVAQDIDRNTNLRAGIFKASLRWGVVPLFL